MQLWLIFIPDYADFHRGKTLWCGRVQLSVVGPQRLRWRQALVLEASEAEVRAIGTDFEAYAIAAHAAVNFIRPVMALGGLLRGFFDPGNMTFEKLREHELAHEAEGEAAVNPTDAQIQQVLVSPLPGPIWMVNLLKYRAQAQYPAGSPFSADKVSGKDAYRKYGRVALRSVALLGGEAMLAGNLAAPIGSGDISETHGAWDEVAIVRYPEPQSLLKLVFMPGYTEATLHRTAGLQETRLIMTTQV